MKNSELKITTFNVGLLDVFLFGHRVFEFAEYTRGRARALADVLFELDSDVLCLQEIYHQHDLKSIGAALSKKYAFSMLTSSRKGSLGGVNHGLAIFSKFPLLNRLDYRFNAQLLDERLFGPKGCLIATIEHPEIGNFAIANLHTTGGGFLNHPESDKANHIRAAQISEACTLVIKQSKNCMLIGDLNCGPEASETNYSLALASGFIDPYMPIYGSESRPTWTPLNPLNANSPHKTSPPQRIDHIFPSFQMAEKIEVMAFDQLFEQTFPIASQQITVSDHYGIQLCVKAKMVNPLTVAESLNVRSLDELLKEDVQTS